MNDFSPDMQFDSVTEALEIIEIQADQMQALKDIVSANIDNGEFGFAAELIQEFGGQV